MKEWIYDTISITKTKGFDATLKSELNKKGKEGWELCGTRELENSITYILKRDLSTDTQIKRF